jgi:glycosyltransferase involved in cell wall biosynthesis
MMVKAHCCVVPNRSDEYMMHALNTKVFECAAMNVPIITSRTETMTKYFSDNQVEFVAPGDKESLKDGIRRLYNDPERYNTLKQNIKAFNRDYNWKSQKEVYTAAILNSK